LLEHRASTISLQGRARELTVKAPKTVDDTVVSKENDMRSPIIYMVATVLALSSNSAFGQRGNGGGGGRGGSPQWGNNQFRGPNGNWNVAPNSNRTWQSNYPSQKAQGGSGTIQTIRAVPTFNKRSGGKNGTLITMTSSGKPVNIGCKGVVSLSPRQLAALLRRVDRFCDKISDAVLHQDLQDLVCGNALTDAQIKRIDGLVADSQCGLSSEERDCISELLVAEGQVTPETPIVQSKQPTTLSAQLTDNGETPADGTQQTERYLKLKNDTSAPITVFVQYRTSDGSDGWKWYPTSPKKSSQAVEIQLKRGEETYLAHQDARLSASRVRIWAESDEQQWHEFKDQDLWLVEQVGKTDDHYYYADDMGTILYVFNTDAGQPPPEKSQSNNDRNPSPANPEEPPPA
jgi:hypothetical protein